MEFKAFPEIKKLTSIGMNITQKIHGTNAHILIYEEKKTIAMVKPDTTLEELALMFPDKKLELALWTDAASNVIETTVQVKVGSRNRYITPLDDNYGFAQFVENNKVEIIQKLGIGRHDGEWAGPGINSGEGLTQKTFVLFDFWKFPPERPLPPQTVVVPVLYDGKFDLAAIEQVMEDLKTNGSKLVPGFMRPEGVVISTMGNRFKKVFQAEETHWKKPDKEKVPRGEKVTVDLTYLLQPIRLEKLLSRDERYLVGYPSTLSQICKDYVTDLEKENQIEGEPEVVLGIKKHLGGQLFPFVKSEVERLLAGRT